MKKRIRYIVIAVIALVVVGGVVFSRQKAAVAQKQAIVTQPAKRATFSKTVSSSGKVKAKKAVELKFQTSGKLTWVGVKEGDRVVPYQAIASLDSREVQKNLEKALRDYSAERNDFEETWRVEYRGLDNPQEALTDTVKRILEKNQWDLEKAVLDVELKHLSVEYGTLTTPIGGIVTRVDMPYAGVNITPATAVFEVIDPDSLTFEAAIDEVDVGAIVKGKAATVTLDAFPERLFEGTVSYISYSAVTSSGGATVFPVEITIAKADNLRIGLNGDVSIEVNVEEERLIVPLDAIREDGEGSFVYRKDNGSYRKTPVEVGQTNETDAVVLSGLAQGDEVVVKGFTELPKK